MKQRLLLFLALLLTTFGGARADEVEIGDGTSADYYNPIGTYYSYSITEQLYTAEEIGMAGTISSISFNYANSAAKDFPITVYMANVDAADLSTGISLADAEEVFNGTLSVTGPGWVTIDLDSPFAYDGTSNLLIGINKDYVYWFSGSSWYYTAVENMARYTQNDSNPYDTSTVPGTVTSKRPNIKIEITPGSGPTCAKPDNFEVSDISGYGATFTWESEVDNYTFEYKKASASDWTVVEGLTAETYTLGTLEPATSYNVRVKAVCGVGLESGYRTAIFETLDVCPDGKVCIGTGKTTNSYLPSYIYYNYSLTQQIYTAAEIGDAGCIQSIDFFKASTNAMTRNMDIYIVATDKDAFESNTDWIPVTEADLAFSGEVTFGDNEWTTIELDNPFEYNGSSNIAIIVDDNTGDDVSSAPFYVFDATNQAIRVYSDGTNYDPSAPSSYTGTLMNVKNRVRLGVADEMPPYLKPTGLTASEIGPHSAVLSWIDHSQEDVDGWKVAYKTSSDADFTEVDVTTNPFTLTDLAGETAYTVKVRPDSDESTEDDDKWSKEITFTTDIACPKPDNLAVTNIDKRSATVSWTSLSGSHELRYTTNIAFQGFVTNPGAMADGSDASWLQGSQGTFGPSVNFTSDYLVADDFTVNSAKTLKEIEVYAYQTGSTTTSTFTGLYVEIYDGDPSNGGNVVWGDMANNIMTSTSFTNCYRGENGDTNGMTRPIMAITASGLNIDLQPGTYWLVFGLTGTGSSGPWLVPYCEPTVGSTGDGLQYSTSEGWIALADTDTNESYGCSMKLTFEDSDNGWVEVNDLTANEYDLTNLNPDTSYLVQVRSYYDEENDWSKWASISFKTLVAVPAPTNLAVDNITARTADLSWTENGDAQKWGICIDDNESDIIEVTEIPATLNNLNPETTYSVKVRAYDEAESEWSQWSAPITFTTDIAWPVPTDVAADNIKVTTADITWTGNEEATGYNLRYSVSNEVFKYDFESAEAWAVDDLSPCTTYDGDQIQCYGFNGSSFTNFPFTGACIAFQHQGDNLPSHSGNAFGMMVCPQDGSQANDWFILPEITIADGDVFSFWAREITDQYGAEVINVGVYGDVDGTFASLLAEGVEVSTKEYTKFEYDLSQYAGQTIRLAINYVSTDIFGLMIDDIVVANSNITYQTITDVTSPYSLSGLTPETTYNVEVQAVYADGESQWAQSQFTTMAYNSVPTNLAVNNILATTATASWTGYSDSYNVKLGTIDEENSLSVNEDFSGEIPTDWVNESENPWTIVDGHMQSGNAGVASSTSAISITKTFPSDGTIEFDAECRGEGTSTYYDHCDFYIDEERVLYHGADLTDAGWLHYSFEVAAGEHTFTWSYTKDSSVSNAGDYFAVDNVVMFAGAINWDTPVSTDQEEYAFEGLTPNTMYFVQVQGQMNEETSEWTEAVSFTTLEGANITFAKEGYATYYNGTKDVVLPTGMKAFVVTGGNGDTTLDYVAIADGDLTAATTNLVPAGVAVMLQVAASTEDGDQTFTVSLASPTATADFTGTNHLLGSDEGVEETTGLGLTGTREYFYKLNYSADGLGEFGWYWGAEDGVPFASPAHKAWLVLEDDNLSSIAELPGHEGATGIQPVAKDTTAAEGWYTISGMKLDKQPTSKGLYIHNGKKVVVE